jgi:hypothetical protein
MHVQAPIVFAIVCAVLSGCSSSSTTLVGAGGSGNDATGGASSEGAGALHVPVTDLGDGKIQLSYDFSTTDQLSDWVPAPPRTTLLSLGVQQLIVTTSGDLAVAVLKRRMWVTRLAFSATIVSGAHLNWYANAVWDGNFNPARGVGGIHRGDGRHFTVDGAFSDSLTADSSDTGVTYDVVVDVADSQVTWTENGAPLAIQWSPVTDRSKFVGVGTWDSTVAISNVTIEGYLGQDTFAL